MTVAEIGEAVRNELSRVITGQRTAIERVLTCFLAGGHVLIEGVPGIAKTLMARAMARVLGVSFSRIQFTPDLMPSDITGVNIYDMQSGEFRLVKGPVFTNFLLADEINRTPPKTQSALLQAMEEQKVNIDGVDHPLDDPFFVIATQNPVEHEGTYPLPEAQLDRFLMKVLMDYPTQDQEVALLRRHHLGFDPHDLDRVELHTVLTLEQLQSARKEILEITVQDAILDYIAAIIRATREVPRVSLGASPRAGVALLNTAKVATALRGEEYLVPDAVKDVAPDVLRHRIILRPEAELEGVTVDRIVETVLSSVPVPQ